MLAGNNKPSLSSAFSILGKKMVAATTARLPTDKAQHKTPSPHPPGEVQVPLEPGGFNPVGSDGALGLELGDDEVGGFFGGELFGLEVHFRGRRRFVGGGDAGEVRDFS